MANLQILTTLAMIAFVAVTTTNAQSCPDNFYLVGSYCLHVNTRYLEMPRPFTLTWEESRKLCQGMSDDTWQVDFVSNYDEAKLQLMSLNVINNYPEMYNGRYIYWVGAQKVGDQWQWLDGTPIDTANYIWVIQNPAPVNAEPGSVGYLVPIGSNGQRLYTYIADETRGLPSFICEAKPKQ